MSGKHVSKHGIDYDEFSNEIWGVTYAGPNEKTLEDFWTRLADGCANVEEESKREEIRAKFYELVKDFNGMPGGRVAANIGITSRKQSTLFNCYVHGVKGLKYKDPDSVTGIYDMLKAQALTLKSEGGYGINFSWLRPNGAYIDGIGARTPGPVKFMELWDKSSEIITMGSDIVVGGKNKNEKKKIRKGAQMGILDIWHPSIEEFIDAKLIPNRLTKFNMSVGITPGFMEAVRDDLMWNLVFPDTTVPEYKTEWDGDLAQWLSLDLPVVVYKTIKARELWDKIMNATYTRNEPGVLFLDIANRLNPLAYGEIIRASNPCFAGSEYLLTENGYERFIDLYKAETPNHVIVDNRITYEDDGLPESPDKWKTDLSVRGSRVIDASHVFKTQENADALKIEFDFGQTVVCTPDHHFATTDGMVEAKDLTFDHQILVPKIDSSVSVFGKIPHTHNEIDAFLMGLIAGDGTFSPNGSQVHIDIWGDHGDMADLVKSLIAKLYDEDYDSGKSDTTCWKNRELSNFYVSIIEGTKKENHKIRITSSWLSHRLDRMYGFNKQSKLIVPDFIINNARSRVGLFYVASVFWCDGHVENIKTAGVNVRLTSTNPEFLRKIQMVMLANGIITKLYLRRKSHQHDIKGKIYLSKDEYQLITRCRSHVDFYEKIGMFGDHNEIKLRDGIANETRKDAPSPMYTSILSITPQEEHEDVYCIKQDITRTIVVNGVTTRRCGEILMSDPGTCNLFTVNLTQYIKVDGDKIWFDYDEYANSVKSAIRYADNVNDIANPPLPEYDVVTKEKRRIGVGNMGLGSIHFMLGIRYGSPESVELTEKVWKTKCEAELLASAELGVEKGSFKLFDAEQYFKTEWWMNLPIDSDVKKKIESLGAMRNSHHSMNAPNGNLGITCNNVSGGIEPVFMKEYTRWSMVPESEFTGLREKGMKFPNPKVGEWFETDTFKVSHRGTEEVLEGSFDGIDYVIDKNRGLVKATSVEDYGWRFAKKYYTTEQIAEFDANGSFDTTDKLTVHDHINVLKVIAKYTNQNSSKTVNLPSDYSFDDFKGLYMDAWNSGIKGITTYRAGTMTAVLEAKKEKSEEVEQQKADIEETFENADGVITENVKLPSDGFAKYYVLKDKNRKKWYVFVNFSDANMTKPFAIFVNTNCKEDMEVTEEVVSSVLELAKTSGVPEQWITDQMEKIKSQSNVTKICRVLGLCLRHNVSLLEIVETLTSHNFPLSSFAFHITRLLKSFVPNGTVIESKKCSECGGALVMQEGCYICKDCGYSKCG